MIDTIGPILFTLFIWWFSTGLILWLDRLPRSTFPYSMAGACVVALAGFVALYTSREKTDVASAYCAFTAAIAVWAWHECSFLFGYVTGPERRPCPRTVADRRASCERCAVFFITRSRSPRPRSSLSH